MNLKVFFLALALLVPVAGPAAPLHLKVTPRGTNQLVFTLSPTITNVAYGIMTRTNSPNEYWVGLTGLNGSNKVTSIVYDLSTAGHDLSFTNFAHWTFVAGIERDSDGDGLPDMYEDLVTRTDPLSG